MNRKVKSALVVASLVVGTWPIISRGGPVITPVSSTAGQSTFDSSIAVSDLGSTATLTGTAPSLGSLAGLKDGAGSPVGSDTNATLTSDAYYDGSAGFGTSNLLASSPSVTFTFNTGAGGSATGYDITSITSTNGWHDHASMSDQHYSVAYSTVAAPSTFISLISVAYNPFDPANDNANAGAQYNSSQVVITDSTGTLATGVAAVKFTFSPYANSGNVEQAGQLVRELDIVGAASSVPEPTTGMLMLAGACGLFARRSRSARTAK